MSVELRPLGVKCNIQCQYCYQNPQRDAGNMGRFYDMEQMKASIEAEGGPFSLFGGEPLLVPVEDLEHLFAWGLEKYQNNSIQTNGTLINDKHIELFKKYKVHVGISIDGPGELNDVRWHGTLERTRRSTQKTETAIARLCREKVPVSLILTLHRNNATADKLPLLHDWVKYLVSLGVRWMRLHLLESESPQISQKYGLNDDENIAALRSFAALERELPGVEFDVFEDMRRMLLGRDNGTTCIWNACDPYTTAAVRGVEGHGQRSNCGRTNKEGIDFVKADQPGFERYLALFATPQEHGGCKGCRFFLMCKGQCPGTALAGDWRNRTEHCQVWKSLYEELERELLDEGSQPLSCHELRPKLESGFLQSWSHGQNTSMAALLAQISPQPKRTGWRQRLQEVQKNWVAP